MVSKNRGKYNLGNAAVVRKKIHIRKKHIISKKKEGGMT
jgi:hypothetical protein